MKKISISLLLLFFALRSIGQMSTMDFPKSAGTHVKFPPHITGPSNQKHNISNRSLGNTSIWLNYGLAINSIYETSQGSAGFLFPDSNVHVNYMSQYGSDSVGTPYIHEIGNIFNAYSDNLQAGYGFQNQLTTATSYTLDSMAIDIAYSRHTDSNIVDTLVVYLFQAAPNNSDITTFYYTGSSFINNFGYDTLYVPFEQYNYQTNSLADKVAPISTLKIPLTEADTSTVYFGTKLFALPTPMNVEAGNLVACAVTFKPGYTYTTGENIDSFANTLQFESLDEVPGGYPYYTPGDNYNVSSIIENTVRHNINTDGYNGFFIPSFAYTFSYTLDDHLIYYHINYTPTDNITILPQSPSICSGGSVTLTVPESGSNYTWSPSTGLSATTGDTVIADPAYSIMYTVTGTDSLGNTAAGTDYVYISPTPITPTITVNYDTLTSSSLTNNQWIHDMVITGATNQVYIANSSGWYQVVVTDPYYGCIAASNTVYVGATGDVVWPGDANDDLTVNNYDLIPIGLYYSETGTARDTTTITWAPHISTNWNILQSDGKDMKYVDCNGDGVINADDTLAVTQNYGLTHPFDSPRQNIERSSGTVPISIVADSSSYHAGSIVHASVLLGSSGNPATNIYGLAYNITFDASNVVPGTLTFNYNNASFMGTKNTNALVLTQLNNDVETAIAGIDHTNKTGYGKIGDLYFTLTNNSSGQLGLSISSYEAVDAGGIQKGLSPVGDTLTVTMGINQLSAINYQVSIYPNPVSNTVFVKVNSATADLQDWTIQINDELGRVLYKTDALNYLNEIDMSKLPCAMYFISIVNQTITSVYPVVKQE